jgi:hypothetical protein
MRDLLSELIQTDRATRVAYLKQLALKELTAIARPIRASVPGGSEEHRIAITESSDIDLLQDHIKETLLPAAELSDAFTVLWDLFEALGQDKDIAIPFTRSARESSNFGKVFWMVFDSVVPYLCSKQFWQKNSDIAAIVYWRRLFETLRALLPLASVPSTPEYVPELLRRLKSDSSVDYWGLVSAVHGIVPTVVEQCVDLRDREACRVHLAEVVEQAISETESLDLVNDYSDSQYWHDEYRLIRDDCDNYATLFPQDDEIPGVAELSRAIEDYPRLNDQPDEDHDYSSPRSTLASSDTDIQQIFSDL